MEFVRDLVKIYYHNSFSLETIPQRFRLNDTILWLSTVTRHARFGSRWQTIFICLMTVTGLNASFNTLSTSESRWHKWLTGDLGTIFGPYRVIFDYILTYSHLCVVISVAGNMYVSTVQQKVWYTAWILDLQDLRRLPGVYRTSQRVHLWKLTYGFYLLGALSALITSVINVTCVSFALIYDFPFCELLST